MLKIKVENMTSSRGNKIANQFIIRTDEGVFFQSYDTVIAFKPFRTGKIILDENSWDYSTTTGKYRNDFLNESIAITRKKISSKEYKLADLNG